MDSAFSEISIILAIATGVAFIMRLLKQPLIIGHILTGIIVGPSVLHIIEAEETISAFSNIGIALLLFIIGLGLNPRVIKEIGKVAVFAGTIQVAVTSAVGYFVAQALGFSTQESAFIAIGLAFSSTIIILKLISDKKEQSRLYAKIAIGMLLVQDIIATFALLFLAASSEGGFQLSDLGELAWKGTVLGIILWLLSVYVLPRFHDFISKSQEFLFLFALGWGFGIATLFEEIGFSIEVGALIAGVTLATQAYTAEISARLRPLRDFFIVVFFISLGGELLLDDLAGVLGPAVALSAVLIVVNPLIIMLMLGLFGYTKQTSFKVAVAMAQISEFSLVFAILAVRQGRLSEEALSVLTMVALITIAISTYFIIYSDKMFSVLEKRLQLFERRKVAFEQESADQYEIAMFGYKKGGSEFVKIFQRMKKPFVVVDYDPEVIDRLESRGLNYLYGDVTDLELLDEMGVDKAKLVVSTLTEHSINKFLVAHIHAANEKAVIICNSDDIEGARELYERGASYVIVSHSIGTEKVSSFIRRNGFKRTEFKKFKDRHLVEIENKIIAAEEAASKILSEEELEDTKEDKDSSSKSKKNNSKKKK